MMGPEKPIIRFRIQPAILPVHPVANIIGNIAPLITPVYPLHDPAILLAVISHHLPAIVCSLVIDMISLMT